MQRPVTIPARLPRRNALALAGAWVAVVLVFWCGLFVPSMRPGLLRPEAADLYGYFFPKFVYGSAELARGVLPLWNPYEYAGVPFLGAAQPAVLYPPRVLLFALLPPTVALHAFMVLHYVLLGAGAFVMLRALALELPGACLGTLLLAFEPLMMAGHYHPPRIACFAWVPWIVAAFVRTVERGGLGAALGLAVAAALQATAGYPEYSLDTALVLVLLWPAVAARSRRAGAGTGLALAAAVLAAMLAAVQLVPLLEAFRSSTRAAGGVAFLAGQRFDVARFGGGLRGWAAAVSTFAYLPALAWALVFVGLAAPRRPYRGALLALWIFASIVLAPALRTLPPFSLFRSFLCWGSIVVVPLAALAGAGLDRLVGRELGRREVVVGALVLAGLLPLFPARSLAWFTATVLFLAVGRVLPRTTVVLVLALTLADVWTFVPPPLPATLRHRYAEGQVPYPLPDAGIRRAAELRAACAPGNDGRILAPPETLAGVPLAGRLRFVQGYPESLAPARMSRLLEAAGLAPATLLALDWERLATARGLLALLEVSCFVVEPGHEGQLADLGFAPGGRLADGRTAYVLRGFERTPRPAGSPQAGAFLASEVRGVESEDAALAAVLEPEFAPRRTVVLERADAPLAPAACVEGGCAPGEVETVAAEPGRFRFRLTAGTASHLVVSANHAPGWRARVDGHPAPVLRADYAFIAVPVPPGAHAVELWYRPRAFAPAALLSLLGVALTAVGGLRCLSRSSWWRSWPRSRSSSWSST